MTRTRTRGSKIKKRRRGGTAYALDIVMLRGTVRVVVVAIRADSFADGRQSFRDGQAMINRCVSTGIFRPVNVGIFAHGGAEGGVKIRLSVCLSLLENLSFYLPILVCRVC